MTGNLSAEVRVVVGAREPWDITDPLWFREKPRSEWGRADVVSGCTGPASMTLRLCRGQGNSAGTQLEG